MNARGDILAPGGTIVKTQEQVEMEWKAMKDLEARTHDIKTDVVLPTKTKAVPQLPVTDFATIADIAEKAQNNKRKIVDSDE